MSNLQQLNLWGEPIESEPPLPPSHRTSSVSRGTVPTIVDQDEPSPPNETSSTEPEQPAFEAAEGIPTFVPVQSAIDAGIFGITAAGPMQPDEHEIAAIVQEHANDLLGILIEIEALQDAVHSGRDPRTGRLQKTEEATASAITRWKADLRQAQVGYSKMLAAFEEGFGSEGAARLDAWVRDRIVGIPKRLPYDPGHPWHYYWAGDSAEPLAYANIAPAEDAGRWLERDLPKNPAKRLTRMQELLTSETQRLEEDRRRYEDIITRGVEALSQFDREIAYGGNDELARASSIALKYNHIRIGLGRVRWLREQLERERRWKPIRAQIAHSSDGNVP